MSRFNQRTLDGPIGPPASSDARRDGLFDRYLQGVLGDLLAPTGREVTSCSICLAAFAELDRLGDKAPAAAFALARVIRSGRLRAVDLWLSSAALRKIVHSEPIECSVCERTLAELADHPSRHVRRDAVVALAHLRGARHSLRP